METSDFLCLSDTPHPDTSPQLYSVAQRNRKLGRWSNAIPLDAHRVQLNRKENDYVCASWVNVGPKDIIVCSAPVLAAFEDFYLMLYQNDVKLAVVATKQMERGIVKMLRWWPVSETVMRYGDFILRFIGRADACRGVTIYKIGLTKGNDTKTINILHYTEWPDFGVPSSYEETSLILRLILEVIKHDAQILLHCSAGMGRSGVLAAAARSLLVGETIFDAVCAIRGYRHGMVQTEEQYEYSKELVFMLSGEYQKTASSQEIETQKMTPK